MPLTYTTIKNPDFIQQYDESTDYLIPVTYNTGTGLYAQTTAGATGVIELPDLESSTIKRVLAKWDAENSAGKTVASKARTKAFELKGKFLQRDIATVELDATYADTDAILLHIGHRYGEASPWKQEYVALFGRVQWNEGEIGSEKGQPDFLFKTMNNRVAITIVAAGNIVPPTEITPAFNATIAKGAMMKRVEITVT